MRFFTGTLLAAAVILASPDSLAAQSFGFRPTVAIGFASMGGADAEELYGFDDSRTAVNVGVAFRWNIAEFLALQPELYWANRGGGGESLLGRYKLRLSYLQLPALLRLGLPSGLVRPRLTSGLD